MTPARSQPTAGSGSSCLDACHHNALARVQPRASLHESNQVPNHVLAPGEISDALLKQHVPHVWIAIGENTDYDFNATVSDLREALKPFGLDVTTSDSLDWNTKYPDHARDLNRICELEQEVADLKHALHTDGPDKFVLRVVK